MRGWTKPWTKGWTRPGHLDIPGSSHPSRTWTDTPLRGVSVQCPSGRVELAGLSKEDAASAACHALLASGRAAVATLTESRHPHPAAIEGTAVVLMN